MSHIRSKNTKPEIKLRKELFRLGYRYRINVKRLPGMPDVVLSKYRTCVFINGCFWHGHNGCEKFVLPKTNADFWKQKIDGNRERDLRNYSSLESMGWSAIVVWECEMSKDKIVGTIEKIRHQLDSNRKSWCDEVSLRRIEREEWRAEIKRRKDENARILSELKSQNNRIIQ